MTCWVVTVEPYHENSTVEAVFSTEALAKAYLAIHGRPGHHGTIWKSRRDDEQYEITEVPLDP